MNRPILVSLFHGLSIWLIGFTWGTVVFMTPALKEIPSIAHISRFPAIGFPLVFAFAGLAWVLAGRFFARCGAGAAMTGLYGLTLAGVNAGLDFVILVIAFGNGLGFYDSLTLWLAYAILYIVPRLRAHTVSAVGN